MYIIRPLGCHFHYAKCIWKQVVNAGLKTQYSKTKDDALSELIVAAIGMAYVPIEELKNAMKILKKLASKLPTGKQKNFGKDHRYLLEHSCFIKKDTILIWFYVFVEL